MNAMRLMLFGSPRLEQDGQPVDISRRKALAMLAYLATTDQPHSRDALATLLWPEISQRRARVNLRRALSDLNRETSKELLLLEGENVTLANDVLWVDVAHFRAGLAARATHGHSPEEICPNCLSLLAEAVDLYQADFLAGFTLRDAPEFDEWQYFEAEGLRQEYASALERLEQRHKDQGEYGAAIPYARRWLALDPLHEPAQQVLMQLYHLAGQSAAALRQYELYIELLDEELGLPPGEETTTLYEAIKANQKLGPYLKKVPTPESKAAENISSPLSTTPRHNLPVQPTPFIGREKELAEISQLLLDERDCRLLTLVGPGGIGKTRLALEAAMQAGHAFSNGAHFVSLAPVGAVEFIVPAIAEALKFNFQGDTKPKKQLLHHLGQKNYLLIIDNFEHLITAAESFHNGISEGEELLSEMLRAAPHINLLVTSRERLNLQEEWAYDVQGMPFPEDICTFEADSQGLEHYAAIQLFLQRARKAVASFACSAEEMAAVIRICELVGGMPLGIELAAPWVRVMSCREIADEIARSFDLLATSLRNVPERHRSMRAILEQTWRQLSAEEQAILSKLSVFRGGCLRETAEVVAGATLLLLSSLVDKALLRSVGGGRYELHELIRQFAQEQLQSIPELNTQTLDRHYRYYAAFLEQQVEGLKGGPQLETVQLMADEIDNVRVAWQRAVELKDLQAVTQSAEGLFLYHDMRGGLVEAESTFRQAVAAFSEVTGEDIGADREAYQRQIGFLLVLHGGMASHTGSLNGPELTKQGAELVHTHTYDQSRQSQYREAFCRMWLGWTRFLVGLYDEAEQNLDESRSIFLDINERWGVAKSLYMISNPYIAHGQFIKAEQALRQSLSICRDIQDSRSRILVNRTLGIVTLLFGDMTLTQELLEEAVSLSQEFNDLFGLESTLRELGKLQTAQGDLQNAAQTLKRSIAICHEIGAYWEGELAYCDLGVLLRVQGDYEAAEQTLQRALDAAITTKNAWWLPRCKAELGCLAGCRKDYILAQKLLSEALDLWEQMNHEPFYAWGLAQLGHIAAMHNANQPAEATSLYKQGLELAVKHRQAPTALNIFAGLAALLIRAGDLQKAADLLASVMRHPASTFETRQKAGKLLADPNVELTSEAVVKNYQALNWQATAGELIDALARPNWDQPKSR